MIHYHPRKRLTVCMLSVLAVLCLPAENMVKNGNFNDWDDAQSRPVGWTVRSPQDYSPLPQEGGLQVKVVKEQGGYGEVLQRFEVNPRGTYRLSGAIRADRDDLAFFQVKRYGGGKELNRFATSRNKGGDWCEVEKNFEAGGAEFVEVLLRWQQNEAAVGARAAFRNLQFEELPPLVYEGEEVPPRVVPTFNSAGFYWKPTGGTESRAVSLSYRKKGEAGWREAMPLWFDATRHADAGEPHTGEYRGSLVYLDAGTEYEARLQLQDGPERVVAFATQSENFKIARTVRLPAAYEGTYVIDAGGNPDEGYVLYEAETGGGGFWDAAGESANLEINASWVIVRGLTLKNGGRHGIILGDVDHVVVDRCDISHWGETGPDGQARNFNSAIFSASKLLHSIVVQHCDMHDPRSDSNSWAEQRPGTRSKHPEGPQAISFMGGQGRYVIRFNRIYSDMDHMFNDGMGESKNFGFAGFPNRDSDIHDNFVSHCWDDALEVEGANMNVRVWNNYIDMSLGAIGGAATSLGPVYYFRNVYAVSRKHSGMSANDLRGHYLLKIGNERPQYTRGKIFLLHNTALQPPSFEGSSVPSSGAQSGIVYTSSKKLQENITSRNNILQMRYGKDWAIRDTQKTFSCDYDFDLYNGRIMAREGAESNGIVGVPLYERTADGRLWLVPGSAGHDAGARLPNFNDNFSGDAPDMGAVETYSQEAKPLHWPDFPENYYPPVEPEVEGAVLP
ncbi:right-handed parallel beta-helix repeat-containing protein [Coraliomargarita parva]|uniref:right-handed parallel beta-helix repeat-containing protein n=1 Tax=Coraliomargarita parva TaxID=3014050 RepID=UPI0022B2C1A2|nr:right-handed parallel beta-helix repeat-containing protein [Coraliomargarita parva]